MAAFKVGQLVAIAGMKEPAETPAEYRKGAEVERHDVNGQMGQLTAFDGQTREWTVATFGAAMVSIKEQYLRALDASDVEGLGLDLALGPASDAEAMGMELVDNLSSRGFSVCRIFVSPEDLQDMVATADRCAEDGAFSRLASEMEPGYLGREGTGKALSFDMDSPDTAGYIKDSAVRIADEAMATVGNILRPYTTDGIGCDIYSRSSTMMSMPFDGDEASYAPPELENEDAASYLTMLWRAKVMVLFNAGPAAASLALLPKAQGGDAQPTVTLRPGTMALFMTDRFRFVYRPEGKALLLSTFYLDAPKEFAIDNVYGDLSGVAGAVSGPAMPMREQIPVVSMGTRYAFGADEPWKVWVGYSKAGWDTQTRHPALRWDCDMYYEQDADQTSGKSYTCHGGFSDGVELFDCKFFDISPAEARGMDPTQRQVLEVSYISLQGAGFTKRQLQAKPANIAAFVGLDKNEWSSIPKDAQGGFGASNSANAITSNRFNYCMNLKGASMTIDTACSSSLVAQHTGKLYLMFKHYDPCEAVITCGVNLSLSPLTYIGCCAAGMHSHLGRCFTYNFSADGYARGEATASSGIKLKNFDKESDLCLLAGSQANQDGRSASLTAPNGPAQERCSLAVIKEVGIKPPEIDSTECHGTGTSLGDPIEIGAYRKVMASVPRDEPVAITTSKSNIGHCEGSAGISGFLKCCLMGMYGEGAPNAHLNCLNPHLDMDGFPGIIVSEGVVWKGEASFNSVLSFGFGGTNACATVWGSNNMTSRALASKDTYQVMLKRIQDAPQQQVTITGDDWEEWEIDFPIKDPKPSDRWDVEIDEDGMVTYIKQDLQSRNFGDEYFLTGTFNNWSHDPCMADSTVEGLHVGDITIGPSGYEEFQVVADQDNKKKFYPETRHCALKSALVHGPGEAEANMSWCIKGEQGDRFRVEFFISEAKAVTISWVRER
uniref:Ketosynthase family 3 (KS3) domain-containing protein n=1 Tax=Zooxanthella nutricula TaxID=1333877 RepID=A0A7S2QPL8_9DINO